MNTRAISEGLAIASRSLAPPQPPPTRGGLGGVERPRPNSIAVTLLSLLAVACCEAPVATETEPAKPPAVQSHFDAKKAGSISGRVCWLGAAPTCPPIDAVTLLGGKITHKSLPNPNAPQIDPATGAIRGAVVFLEGVSPEMARPWNYSPVRIEIHADEIQVVQGDMKPSRIGFVHAGDEIEIVSKDSQLHTLCARGGAFFSLAFPDPDQPLRRKLTKPGLVELTSGAAKYWHRAYLWVGDHPYFALTDAGGKFSLPQVPAGHYRLVCWHPNGKIAAKDRDPNTGMVMRYHFAEPIQIGQPVEVKSGANTTVDCFLGP
jgi:hypothetical protein